MVSQLLFISRLQGLRATIYHHRMVMKKAHSPFRTTVDGKPGGRNPIKRALVRRIISGESDSCPWRMSIRDIHNLLKESLSSLFLSLEWSLLSNAFNVRYSLHPVSYNVDLHIQPQSDKVIFAQSRLYDHGQIRKQWNNNKGGMY
jgi:hypothetical protein